MQKELGLKIGLEIHQQIDTHKLFCNCPSLIKENQKPNTIIKRNLFAVSGELGKIDIAALHEQEKDREFYYYFWNDSCCLVELDETPPKLINKEALKITLQIAILLNAEILPLTQVMRKIVVDGSDVTGFQRTMLIAKNGKLEYKFEGKKKEIKIETICLEEESARRIKEENNKVYFGLDRYGIPLIEITTAPTIKSLEEAKIVALKLGNILRSCKVKRGLGTIRQDINISIKNGVRTEIKGVQEPKLIPKVLENEIKFQLEAIKKGRKLEASVKKANEDGSLTFLRPLPGSARMYPETDLPLVEIDKILNEAKKDLPKLVGEIKEELIEELENKDYAEEIARNKEKYEIYNKFKVKEKEVNKILANIITSLIKEISREIKISENELLKKIEGFLGLMIKDIENKKISKQAVKEIIIKTIKEGNYENVRSKFEIWSQEKLENEIKKFISESKIDEKYLIPETIKRFKFNADVKDIISIVKKFNKKMKI